MTKIEDLIWGLEIILKCASNLSKIPDLNEVKKIVNEYSELESVSTDNWFKFHKLLQYIYKEHTELTNIQNKSRKYRKLCIRIANAYGYKNEKTDNKIDLVSLNLTKWQDKCYNLSDLNFKRFWQAVNKLQKLLYGKCY